MTASIKVLVVDDSAYIRHIVAKHLQADAGITVVGSARNGLDALDQLPKLQPDVIILDVEMPQMDGLTALKHITAKYPTPVIMLSALTHRGSRATIQALMRGAFDFVPKPDAQTNIQVVVKQLITKIKTAASTSTTTIKTPSTGSLAASPKQKSQPLQTGDPVIVIGTSTGGPRALHRVLSDLPAHLPAAIVLVQHMPGGFTRSLAQRLNEVSPLKVREAVDGDRLERGLALLAPGDFHLRCKNTHIVALDDGPRRNHVRPAVDITMESAAKYYGPNVIGAVLTGMGIDGTAGAECIKAAGGRVVAEHESSSAIYGMPASVINAGLADQVAPLSKIAATLIDWTTSGKSGI